MFAGPAFAAPALLVPLPDDEADARRFRDRVQLVTGTAVAPDRTYGPDDLQAAVGYKPLRSGAIESFTCKGPAVDQAGFDARLGLAMSQVDGLELEEAEGSLMALKGDLPCSVSVIGARQLHDIFFFAGLMAAYNGQKDDAIERFARAVSIKSDVPLDTDFPPAAQQLYLLGRERSSNQETVSLTFVPPVGTRSIWVDGRPLPDPDPVQLELRPGTHLIHIETTEGAQRAFGFDLGPGESRFADHRAAAAAALSGVGEGPLGAAANGLLAAAAERWGAETLYVGSERGVFVFGGSLARARVPLKPTGDRLGLRVGGGVLIREGDHFPQPFVYGAPAFELDVALLRGLEIGAAVQVGVTSVVADTASLLPAVSAGLQWAWSGTTLRPYAGLRAAVIVAGVDDVRAGGLVVGGIRLQPRRDSALRIGVGVNFGWTGGIQAGATVTIGAGLGGPQGVTPSP